MKCVMRSIKSEYIFETIMVYVNLKRTAAHYSILKNILYILIPVYFMSYILILHLNIFYLYTKCLRLDIFFEKSIFSFPFSDLGLPILVFTVCWLWLKKKKTFG